MLKKAVNEWMQESSAYAVEVRLGSIASLVAGFLLRNRVSSTIFLISVPIGAIVLSTWSEYFVRRWNRPFRSGARGGLAIGCTLLPLLLVSACVCAEWNKARNLDLLYYLINLMSACSLMSMVSTVCWLAPTPNHYGLVVVATLVMSGVAHSYLPSCAPGFWWIIVPLWCYMLVVIIVLEVVPGSLSAGEAVIVAEGIFLVCFDVLMQTVRQLGVVAVPRMFAYDRSAVLLAVEVMLVFALVCGVGVVMPWRSMSTSQLPVVRSLTTSVHRWSLVLWAALLGSLLFVLLPWMQLVMKVNILVWSFTFLLSPTRLMLIGYWCMCLVVAVVIVRQGYANRKIMLTDKWQLVVARKKFHILAVAIYLPGLMWDQDLLMFASGIASMLFILLEYVRALKLWPIGLLLDQQLRSFVDSRDSGAVLVTHLFLLLGMSLPVFAYPITSFRSAPKLATYAGLLSLGVGDTAASLFGMKFGKRKWPKMDKTVEGTLASIVAQMLCCLLLTVLDPNVASHFMRSWHLVLGAISVAAVMEAFTGHIDNLILPPFLSALLLLT